MRVDAFFRSWNLLVPLDPLSASWNAIKAPVHKHADAGLSPPRNPFLSVDVRSKRSPLCGQLCRRDREEKDSHQYVAELRHLSPVSKHRLEEPRRENFQIAAPCLPLVVCPGRFVEDVLNIRFQE